jgi:hypothetical protein
MRENVGLSKVYKQTLREKERNKERIKNKNVGGRDYIYKGGEKRKERKGTGRQERNEREKVLKCEKNPEITEKATKSE